MKLIITQSNYIPWKGYFDSINQVDKIVLYDDMQYTKRDWRNRNLIKTPNGLKWLTIPVNVKGKFYQKINETEVSDIDWNIKHLNILKENYKTASAYNEVIKWVEKLYLTCKSKFLSEINFHFLKEICDYLDIKTEILTSKSFNLVEGKTERLIGICNDLNASEYLSGPAAKNYMDEELFTKSGIKLTYLNYNGYKEYPQIHGGFEHGVSVLDVIFNLGEKSKDYYAK